MEPIPFTSFFNALRKNGFSVTHTQIIQAYKIILKYTDKVKDDEALCLYLVPIFANSEAEQQLFKELFEAEFNFSESLVLKQSIRQRLDTQGKKNPVLLILIYFIVASLLVYFIVHSINRYRSFDPAGVEVFIRDINADKEAVNTDKIFHTRADSVLDLDAYVRYEGMPLKELLLKVAYNWGDDTSINQLSRHTYKAAGEYRVTAYVEVFYKEEPVLKYNLHYVADVCPAADLAVAVPDDDAIPIGHQILLSASVSRTSDPSNTVFFQWKEGPKIIGNQRILRIAFDVAGNHDITCIAHFGDVNSACRLEKKVLLYAGERSQQDTVKQHDVPVKTVAKELNKEVIYQNRSKTFLYWLYTFLAVVFCGLSIFFSMLYQKAIVVRSGWKSATNDHLHLVVSPSVNRLKKDLHFKNHNYLITDQQQLNEIAKPLRNRINGNVELLHVQKTIQKSINSFGLFQAVTVPLTRPPEYLVLIDRNETNPLMVQLFEYLVDLLQRQNIVVEKFYFKHDPAHCESLNEPGGISLDKLSSRYNKTVLLIFGDAHQMVLETYASIDTGYLEIINQWQYKAVITPVCYNDWGVKENILSAALPLFPPDVEGLAVLSALLFNDKKDTAIALQLKASATSFYTSTGIDFENVNELAAYCDQAAWACINENGVGINVMFEWIKALAIYPKIHWQVMVAVGKAILEQYGMPGELNFTNLLHTVRIDWIRQGVFPDGIRLELLKKLSNKNEVAARETVLKLLNEIPAADAAQDTTAYAERELQKVINGFNLYAQHPGLYPQYRHSKDVFEDIWTKDLLTDKPLQLYLTNQDAAWKNLLQHDAAKENYNIEKYFEAIEIEETNLSRLYLWLSLISVFVFVSSFFAILILYKWDAVGM